MRQHVAAAIDAGTTTDKPGWEKPVFAALLQDWQPALAAVLPHLPAPPPNLGQVFAVTADGDVDFAAAVPALDDADIDKVGEFGAPRGGFRDWLRSMLRWSNNTAASRCILALGYPFIAGTLRGAGFIDADLASGLWLSGDYAGHDWVPNGGAAQANAAGRALSPRWATAQKRARSNFTATAAQVATLMTLLARDMLGDQAASQEMRELMTGADGIGSYIRGALARDGRDPGLVVSKIGYGDDTRSHDCAIVERTVDGKALRYVVVGLGSQAGNRRSLEDLFIPRPIDRGAEPLGGRRPAVQHGGRQAGGVRGGGDQGGGDQDGRPATPAHGAAAAAALSAALSLAAPLGAGAALLARGGAGAGARPGAAPADRSSASPAAAPRI